RSMVMSEKEKRNTAYHEAGHAIVGYTMDEHDPLYKVTIMPRGRALGLTMFLPEEDRYSLSRRAIRSQICGLFGGRIAEQMILGDEGVTTGAANDIERATSLARSMVTKWGLSDSMGPLKYDEEDQEVFLGRSASTKPRTVSSRTAHAIDTEVRRIIDDCYALAENVLNEHKNKLHSMAEALIEYETLVFEQIEDIMQGRRARSPEDCGRGSGSRASASAQPKPKNRTRRAGPTVGRPAEEV
ncbi:MAG: ATP-dependent metalloprotease, partial [Gammaproteobacteria bacterium]|nr:ATP-dependent metalloprotease [Gammaproteobacteria bacterium]